MIEECILNEWKRQAEKDGNLEDYEYHLGMVYPPLPYQMWRMKKDRLDYIQCRMQEEFDKSPDSIPSDSYFDQETKLCNELGY